MRFTIVRIFLLVAAAAPATPAPAGTFEAEVRPILEKHCQPCHFTGGKMYAALPFDRPATIVSLGEKMFTRIKDERERAAIRKLLNESQLQR